MTDVRDAPASSTQQTGGSAQGHLIWYELMTPDGDASKAFYDQVVGWNIGEPVAEYQGYRMIGRSDGGFAGGLLQLTDEMQQHGARPTWLGYIGVDDTDAAVSAIEQAGGKALMPAFDIPKVGRVAMVADPQGAPFCVMKPIPPENDPTGQSDVFSVDQPQRVRWNELATDDPDGAIRFYGDQFGWTQEGDMDMPVLSDAAGGVEGGEMGKYRFIQSRGTNIGAVMKRPPQLPVSMWTYYFGVENIDRAAEAVKSGGGQVVNGPMEIPGGEFAVNAIDPHGAAFGLVGPRK